MELSKKDVIERERIAVLVPCLNEESTIAKVVGDFREVFPHGSIFVFDNGSTDRSAILAAEAGAVIVPSNRRGKGNVVRHMFDTIDADVYLMVDGDDTYPAAAAPGLIEVLKKDGADMVVGTRMAIFHGKAFRRFHEFGNKVITGIIGLLFGVRLSDVLSGYRVFSREMVKTIPLFSQGFEVETEITLQAIAKKFSIVEVPVEYGERPEGSVSKLNTFTDGWVILRAITMILRHYKPLVFFSSMSVVLIVASLVTGFAPVMDFVRTGYVFHLPRAVLAASFGMLAAFSLGVGIVLDTVNKYHTENFLIWRRLLKKK